MDISITIIIPTCNRPSDLRRCLSLLQPQVEATQNTEVLVCDDSQGDESMLLVQKEFSWCRWCKGPQQGPAANRNLGAKGSTGEWLIFLDDDCLPAPSYLEAYLTAFKILSNAKKVIAGAIETMPEKSSLLWEAPCLLQAPQTFRCSCNFAISHEIYNLIGGFDERYKAGVYAEDVEFGARLQVFKIELCFAGDARVIHPMRRIPTPKKLARRWEGKVIASYDYGASSFRILWALPWHVFRILQSRFRGQSLDSDNIKAFFLFALEWIWVVYLTPQWIQKWSHRRSLFWIEQIKKGMSVPKYGF